MSKKTNNIRDEVGWLSPAGEYFPCGEKPVSSKVAPHLAVARKIVSDRYPGQCDMQEYGAYGPQDFLLDQGWVRIDVEDVWFRKKPTGHQIDTMFDLYEIAKRKSRCILPKEQLRQGLAWAGLRFLRKPGDDYTIFDRSVT